MRTAAFRVMLAVTVLGFGGHALALPVVPLWVSAGGAGAFGAGATTGVFMAVTVAAQLVAPAAMRRFGHRAVLGSGLALLGAPTPFLLLSTALAPVLALSAVRGAGFGLMTVVGSAMVAELVPRAEHGRATARYGYAVGLPQLAVTPAGVLLAELVGFRVVFVLAGVLPLVGAVLSVLLLRAPGTVEAPGEPARTVALPERVVREAAGPVGVMVACAVAQGGLTTFLPLVVPGAAAVAALALLASQVGQLAGRGFSGGLIDRRGAGRLLLPGALLAAVGMAVQTVAVGITAGGGPAWPLAVGAFMVGLGFGLAQNDALVALFALAGPTRYGAASAAWNISYDAGTGLGSSALGAIAEPFGYQAAFAASTLLLVGIAPLAHRRGAGRPPRP